jgi:hypothetical protein
MRKTGLLLFLMPACAGCVKQELIRPLRPLELATSLYSPAVTAARSGSLMYERGCLMFRADRTDAVMLPIWPDGSILDGTSVTFHEPAKADQKIFIGEQLLMEGRDVPWRALSPAYFAPFQQQCGGRPFLVSGIHPAN